MKKKLFGLMIIAVMFMFPFLVSAEEGTGSVSSVKIGEDGYATLKEAIEAVEVCTGDSCEVTTINVVANHETSGIKFASGKHIVVDLGGFTVTFKEPTVGSKGTETQDMQILKSSTITFKNGKFVSSNTEKSKMFIQNYANLTLEDVEIVATNDKNLYAVSNNSGDVNIVGTTSIKAKGVAFDVCGYYGYPIGPKVVVDTTGTIEGIIEVTKVITGTVTRELSLLVKNINHIGEISIQEGLEEFVTFENGSYTDEIATELVEPAEGSSVYEVTNTTTGETKYVVATEEELENKVFEDEESVMNVEEFEKALKELEESEYDEDKELLAELKKALEGKTTVSAHNILYGSFIEESLVVNSIQSELEKAVKVTLNVPKTLEKVKEGFNRKYSVIRLHKNDKGEFEVDVLPGTLTKDGLVEFETDRFSTYVLAYEDVKDTTNPNTFDGISSIMFVVGLSLISLLAVALYAKNKKIFN